MALSDFEKLVTIAKGSFGTVYKAVRKDNGRVYALKQVEIANMNRAEREEAVDEVRALDARRVNATRQPKLFRETRHASRVLRSEAALPSLTEIASLPSNLP
jgi:serine/threonine protein kinase